MARSIGKRAIDRASQDVHPFRAPAKGGIDQESAPQIALVEDLDPPVRVKVAENVQRLGEAMRAVEGSEPSANDNEALIVHTGELNGVVRSRNNGYSVAGLKEREGKLAGGSCDCAGYRPDVLPCSCHQPVGRE